MATKGQCFGAGMFAKNQNIGSNVDEASIEPELIKDPHLAEVYTKHSAEYDQELINWQRIKNAKGVDAKTAAAFEELTGVKWQSINGFFNSPTQYLGEDFTKPILDALEGMQEADPNLTIAGYRRRIKPLVQETLNRVKDLDMIAQNKAYDWLRYIEEGGPYFRKGIKNPVAKFASNAVGNLVTNNPAITLYNVFEFLPKALVYANQNGDMSAMGRAMRRYMDASGGKFWERIPELETKGFYGQRAKGKIADFMNKKLGFDNLIDLTENPLRGMSYYLGEEIKPGTGAKAIEDIAFAYRPGNEPQMMWNHEGKATVMLMRFSIKSMQLYGSLAKQAIQGNKKAAASLAMFHVMTAAQTGTASSIPKPVWAALPEDMREELEQFEGISGAIGLDIAENTQPFGGVAFGLGYNIATSDLAALSKIPKAIQQGLEGDIAEAAYTGGLGLIMAAQLARIPGVNMNAIKFYKAAVNGSFDNLNHIGDMPEELMKQYKLAKVE